MVVLALLFVMLFGHAMVLAAEFVVMHAVNRHEPVARARPGQLLVAWVQECLHAPRVFGWLQPFRSQVWPDVELDDRIDRRGVVLTHGFVCNRGIWNDWLARLQSCGTPAVAVNLEPPWGPIDAYVEAIERAVARIEQVTGRPPLIVAHSMGGLAVRRWWLTTHAERVHHLITLGSPHRGTWLARLGLSPNVRQMRLHSEWLAEIAALEGPGRVQRMTCFYSACDNIVFPTTTATIAGASNRHLCATAHVHMVSHPAPWAEAVRQLELPQPGTTAEAGPS